MDIVTLRLFITLARKLHFGKTSELMHMSPSAVSRAIQRLENQLGHGLLLRDNRSSTNCQKLCRMKELTLIITISPSYATECLLPAKWFPYLDMVSTMIISE